MFLSRTAFQFNGIPNMWKRFPNRLKMNFWSDKSFTHSPKVIQSTVDKKIRTMRFSERSALLQHKMLTKGSELEKIYGLQKRKFRDMRQKILETKPAKGIIGMIKKYGVTGFTVYMSIYFISLGTAFVCVMNGLVTTEQVVSVVKKTPIIRDHINLDELDSKVDSTKGKFLVAWVLVKLIEPLRMILATAITPFCFRVVRPQLLRYPFFQNVSTRIEKVGTYFFKKK